MNAHLSYRPEIDGLRAIAVLSVVLYHFGLPGVPGGFVGVDVFFVISGFLIGGILWGELKDTGRISLPAFYVRRIRRLFPAFFVMALATLAVGWAVLLPYDFRELGKAVIAATVYLSNVLFYRDAGYFDTGAEEKVLLHTWSLSVEEQFYLVLPLTLLLLRRWPRLLLGALIALFFASLAACVALTPRSQPATFYLFPFRAWELLAGVLLAIMGRERRIEWRAGPVLSWLGLALILVSVATIPAGPTFPGGLAALPVLGTVLVILNGRHPNGVNALLAHCYARWIGLISYSLYLWHWPVAVLSRYWRGEYAGPLEVAGWIALSFALAWASWRFVERPFRRSAARNWGMVSGMVLGSGALLGAGAVLFLRDGMIDRFPLPVRTHIAASADFLQDWSRCHTDSDGPLAGVEQCPIGPEGAPKVLIWGDSHVRAVKEGLEDLAWDTGTPGLILWHAGCPPIFGVLKVESAATPAQDADCARDTETIRDALGTMETVQHVLLVGRWAYYATGAGVGLDRHNRIELYPVPDGPLPRVRQDELLMEGLALTALELGAAFDQVFLLRQVPEMPRYNSRLVAREMAHGRLEEGTDAMRLRVRVTGAELEARSGPLEAAMVRMQEAGRLTLIDTWPTFCKAEYCTAMPQGASWYFDGNHVTNSGARALIPALRPVFAGLE
ncbi:acyltransferase family protein [Mesobacterium pallidum]|uniref:acyltransferase family protein n=1 Tax=Mesobacterium pallidum TaxID=2872037 RepID=UPI001EE2EC92|nr:acyltransferase family protein [Mesobacterium pallidum]